MDQVYLCLEPQCKGKSRIVMDIKQMFQNTGVHFNHNCRQLDDIQEVLESHVQLQDTNHQNTIIAQVDEACALIREESVMLIDKLTSKLRIYVQAHDELMHNKLIQAVLENDLKYLEENQDLFPSLSQPEQLIEISQKKFFYVRDNVTRMLDQINDHLPKIVNFEFVQGLEKSYQESDFSLIDEKNGSGIKEDQMVNIDKQIAPQQSQSDQMIKQLRQINTQLEEKFQLQNTDITNLRLQIIAQKQQSDKIIQQLKLQNNQLEMELDLSDHQKQKPIRGPFQWSSTYKQASISIDGRSSKTATTGSINYILLEPNLSFSDTKTVQLKFHSGTQCMIQICDLKVVRAKCSNFVMLHCEGGGAYSHNYDGRIFATDTYGQGTTTSFTFRVGDILELQWNGPLKRFTTIKLSTGERFTFDVKFNADAEIYFGAGLHAASMEIM